MRLHRLASLAALILPSASLAADPAPFAFGEHSGALARRQDARVLLGRRDLDRPDRRGQARPLTRHPERDAMPVFSSDGKEIAFVSDREGSPQVFTMPGDIRSAFLWPAPFAPWSRAA